LLLEVNNINAGYDFLQILRNLSLNVDTGEYVCLVGPNGAGKSTILKSIAGLLKPMSGAITFNEEQIDGLPGHEIHKKGISYVSEDLDLFTAMSVRENLAMGAYTINDKKKISERLDFVYALFPRLKEREHQLSGTMSGGERKMLAIGRGMMSNPKLMLFDEPSMGLSPEMTNAVFNALGVLNSKGVTILLVEQNVTKSFKVSTRGYVLEHGEIVLQGPCSELARNEHIRKVFLWI
jgi:branched-chain amino acid transport system ATP-binding protein